MTCEIKNNRDRNRFESQIEGHLCELNYTLNQSVMTMHRIYVPAPLEGRGIAGAMTRFALDDCSAKGCKVIPRCPYVAAWIKRHPEYEPLVHSPE